MNINIGGGHFSHAGWLNLDGRQGFRLSPETTFPAPDRSAPIVYSSHCLEHLDDATVDRVLAEARRVCTGELVLKLPDFEEVLARWQARDHDYFKLWGIHKIWATWRSQGIEDTIDARAAFVFCGWWNKAYGDEWGVRTPGAPGAFHGPATTMRAAPGLDELSPHQLAMFFRAIVEAKHPHARFNHRNAWSRAELAELLARHGFRVETMDAAQICRLPIPTIEEMRAISLYVHCR